MAYERIANDYGLTGKVAIVSGAGGPVGQGLEEGVTNGRAAAILLARAGAKVCVVGRSLELAQHTVDIIKSEGSGWDSGKLVRFLLSDQSKFLTGQSIVLDGGASLIGPAR